MIGDYFCTIDIHMMSEEEKLEKSDYGVSSYTGSFMVWIKMAPIIRSRADFLSTPTVVACYFKNTIPFQCIEMENRMTSGGQLPYQVPNRRCLPFKRCSLFFAIHDKQ